MLSLPQKRAHRPLIKPFVRIKQFRIMYLRTVLLKKSIERRFVEDLDAAQEVCVYAKLPKGFHIPTPCGELLT